MLGILSPLVVALSALPTPDISGLDDGKVLGVVSSAYSLVNVGILPSQAGNAGKYLATDGSASSWNSITSVLPNVSAADNGKVLTVVSSNWVASTPSAAGSSKLNLQVGTPVGNIGAGEDDLLTYSLPAGTLVSGKGIRITGWGTTANTAAAKTLKMYIGTQAIHALSMTINSNNWWRCIGEVYYTASSAQDYNSILHQGGNTSLFNVTNGSATQNDAGALTVKMTGTATNNNDLIQRGMLVELI